MKFGIRIIILAIIDFVIVWLLVKQINPDPSVSIAIVVIVPFVVVLNLTIALILYFIKKEFASLFLINSIIAGVLMYYLFVQGIDRYQNARLKSWRFELSDTTFVITHWKLDHTFSISERTFTGSSTDFLRGQFIQKENESYLTTDSTNYIIKGDYFYGFRSPNDSIKLRKIKE